VALSLSVVRKPGRKNVPRAERRFEKGARSEVLVREGGFVGNMVDRPKAVRIVPIRPRDVNPDSER